MGPSVSAGHQWEILLICKYVSGGCIVKLCCFFCGENMRSFAVAQFCISK